MQVTTATFTHKHGSDVRVFADASGAEAWRLTIAAEGWPKLGALDEAMPADPVEAADRYFEIGSELGDEFFETTETELEGFSAPDAPAFAHSIVVVLEGGICQAVASDNPTLVGLSYTVVDYDTDGVSGDEVGEVRQDDGTYADACIGGGTISVMTVKIPTDADYERAVRAAGWEHGGDNGGFWYNGSEFESWKAAASSNDAVTYGTPKEISDAEGIDPFE